MKFKKFFMLAAVLLASGFYQDAAAQNVGDDYYEAFIEYNGSLTDYIQYQLRLNDVLITGKYDGFITARVNPNVTASQIVAIENVEKVTRALPLETCSDSARYYSRVDGVHLGEGLNLPYTGKDVIVGIIDCGFDFNHINLCDENGSSRVKAVYMPMDESGTSPVIRAVRLPGSCYESPSQIRSLTTDDPYTPHGTQIAGIAAGAYRANGWYGMAPDADLVLCGIPEDQINDVRVANCVSYICDYATRKNKPCVINISLSRPVGPHDGTSYLSRVFSQFSGPGKVFVVSAGNDGDKTVCAKASITSKEDTVITLLSGAGLRRTGYVNAWSIKDKPFNTRFIVMNTQNGAILYRSRPAGATAAGVQLEVSSDNDTVFAKYCYGTLKMTGGVQANNRPSSLCEMDITPNAGFYAFGFMYYSPMTTSLSIWASPQAPFYNYGYSWVNKGQVEGSINDLATTDSVISVGSYNSRQYVPLKDGSTYYRYRSVPMELSYYSAFGPDDNGIQRPDVCAPGSVIISSANRYDLYASNMMYWQPSAWVDGVEYPYCPDLGTSMSAPVVTGAVALWLQANPTLSAADVRDILYHSSYKDYQVNSGQPSRWGSGKLDVMAGMRYILHIEEKTGDVNGDGEINISDVNMVISLILGGTADADTLRRADVNNDGEINISDINKVLDTILN